MADFFVAEIVVLGCNFAPRGFAFCNGQILPIAQNTALFSLLGTTYGGNGTTTFGLPNLQGNAVISSGQGPGLSLRSLGEVGGSANHTLTVQEMPTHTHIAQGKTGGNNATPTGLVWANTSGRPSPNNFATTIGTAQNMQATALSNAGGSQPHNNLMPYITMNFCIALQGVYPARS
jgi:microcystin-dependent protein